MNHTVRESYSNGLLLVKNYLCPSFVLEEKKSTKNKQNKKLKAEKVNLKEERRSI